MNDVLFIVVLALLAVSPATVSQSATSHMAINLQEEDARLVIRQILVGSFRNDRLQAVVEDEIASMSAGNHQDNRNVLARNLTESMRDGSLQAVIDAYSLRSPWDEGNCQPGYIKISWMSGKTVILNKPWTTCHATKEYLSFE